MDKVFTKRVTKSKFYEHYLRVMNGILMLTDSEIAIAAEFMSIQEYDTVVRSYLTDDERRLSLFSKESRKEVATKLNISIPNLNNYIKKIKDKKVFIEDNDVLTINPKLYTNPHSMSVQFKLIIDEQDLSKF